MIRINLLREPAQKRLVWTTPDSSRIGLYGSIALLGVLVGMSGWYWTLLEKRAESRAQKKQLVQEALELETVKIKLEKSGKLVKMLNDRITVIERLKSNQKGPVLLMNGIINSIPEEPNLWLSSLEQREDFVAVEGSAFNMESVADFIASLDESAPFKQVDLDKLQEEENSIRFTLSCKLQE